MGIEEYKFLTQTMIDIESLSNKKVKLESDLDNATSEIQWSQNTVRGYKSELGKEEKILENSDSSQAQIDLLKEEKKSKERRYNLWWPERLKETYVYTVRGTLGTFAAVLFAGFWVYVAAAMIILLPITIFVDSLGNDYDGLLMVIFFLSFVAVWGWKKRGPQLENEIRQVARELDNLIFIENKLEHAHRSRPIMQQNIGNQEDTIYDLGNKIPKLKGQLHDVEDEIEIRYASISHLIPYSEMLG